MKNRPGNAQLATITGMCLFLMILSLVSMGFFTGEHDGKWKAVAIFMAISSALAFVISTLFTVVSYAHMKNIQDDEAH